MKKGYYYYMLLTPEERKDFKTEFLFYRSIKDLLKSKYNSFYEFIAESCPHDSFWLKVATSERSHRPKKKQKEKPRRCDIKCEIL